MRYILLLFAFITSIAFGRLGDTKNKCIERYGEPISVDVDKALTFKKSNLQIKVWLWRGTVAKIEYLKLKTDDRFDDHFKPEDVTYLWSLNCRGEFDQQSGNYGRFYLISADKNVVGVLSDKLTRLEISTAEYNEFLDSQDAQSRKAEAEKKLSGL